jgi:hypothetical protein
MSKISSIEVAQEVEKHGLVDVVEKSWLDPDDFEDKILTHYFKQFEMYAKYIKEILEEAQYGGHDE